eukprot:CAMPEP_0178377080 /NCGR_PEP_ID=MMETSP0689_2-20121128/3734_1 /TAXON_ID=160604 /ORGANISM="Amphidinium massartii, Strain CS-259" /LENGTH=107 /DNA_ID=CAMNT_0019997123 /DNA_START=203 /DNA_END=526 /DNA_ORIENTATION=+
MNCASPLVHSSFIFRSRTNVGRYECIKEGAQLRLVLLVISVPLIDKGLHVPHSLLKPSLPALSMDNSRQFRQASASHSETTDRIPAAVTPSLPKPSRIFMRAWKQAS